jgi:N-terminal acetyltransferase B complex non-catalytic subunit
MAEDTRVNLLKQSVGDVLNCQWCSGICAKFCPSCLQSLAAEALFSYHCAIESKHVRKVLKSTDKHPADERAIVAAMCLVKLAGGQAQSFGDVDDDYTESDIRYLLQATVILEFAYTHSKANSHISLLLVRLYSQLGAGSLAMRAYYRLGLKQIQNETLGYLLFDRISSLHPHAVTDARIGSKELLDPSTQLKRLQSLNRAQKNQCTTNSWRSFEHGSYDSVFQMTEVSDRLSRSMALAMSAIELRKIHRLSNPDAALTWNSHGYDLLRKCMLLSDPVLNLIFCSNCYGRRGVL